MRTTKRFYQPEFTRKTYDALHSQAEEELRSGRGVIVDATYKQQDDRDAILALGTRCHIPVLFVECQANAATVEMRLRERERRDDTVSDATWALAQQERESFPLFSDLPEQCHVVVDTAGDIETALVRVEERLGVRKS